MNALEIVFGAVNKATGKPNCGCVESAHNTNQHTFRT